MSEGRERAVGLAEMAFLRATDREQSPSEEAGSQARVYWREAIEQLCELEPGEAFHAIAEMGELQGGAVLRLLTAQIVADLRQSGYSADDFYEDELEG